MNTKRFIASLTLALASTLIASAWGMYPDTGGTSRSYDIAQTAYAPKNEYAQEQEPVSRELTAEEHDRLDEEKARTCSSEN